MTSQPSGLAPPSEPERQQAVRHAEVALRSIGQPNSVAGEFDFWNDRYEGRRLFSELLGTFFLVLVAVGGGMVSARFGGNAVPYGAKVVAPALMVMAIILFMGTVSGNVLGYTLNEHLKETKDQIGSTPQRLLNLETKYVTGEVSDQEYRGQREEFKNLLQRNLHSIEEIKEMIEVLTHIETKPLAPGDFKQTNPVAPRTIIEEWARAAPQQSIPNTTQPAQTPAPTPASPSIKFAASSIISERPWALPSTPPAPQPSSNVANWTGPQTNNTPLTSPAPATTPVVQEPTQPVPTISATPIITAPTAPFSEASSTVTDDSLATAPAQDYVEDVADALVVKVVDDMPIVDASAAVATTESEISPSIPGTETVPGIPSGPDLSQSSVQLPSQFYKVVCPKCGADVPKAAKVWELKGGKSKKNVLIGLFQCQDCRVKFREALTRDII